MSAEALRRSDDAVIRRLRHFSQLIEWNNAQPFSVLVIGATQEPDVCCLLVRAKMLALIVGSLHHNLASHLPMNGTEVGKRSRLGKRVRELFVRIQHLGLEHTVCTDNRMGNIIAVGPGNSRADSHCERRRPEAEVIDFHVRGCRRGRLSIRRDVRRFCQQQRHRDLHCRQTCNADTSPYHL
jgi:hypothetical protein